VYDEKKKIGFTTTQRLWQRKAIFAFSEKRYTAVLRGVQKRLSGSGSEKRFLLLVRRGIQRFCGVCKREHTQIASQRRQEYSLPKVLTARCDVPAKLASFCIVQNARTLVKQIIEISLSAVWDAYGE
jgi:hypothetical protein